MNEKIKKACCVKSSLKHICFRQWNTWTSSCFVHQIRVSILPKETKHWLNKRESSIYSTVTFSQLVWLNRSEAWAHAVTVTATSARNSEWQLHQKQCSDNSNGQLFCVWDILVITIKGTKKGSCFKNCIALSKSLSLLANERSDLVPEQWKLIIKQKIYLTKGLSKISEIIAFFIKKKNKHHHKTPPYIVISTEGECTQ